MKLGRAPTTWRIFTRLPCARPPGAATAAVIQRTKEAALGDESLVHYEVEPNYAGWTLAAYVAEKLKRPLSPERLLRLLPRHGPPR